MGSMTGPDPDSTLESEPNPMRIRHLASAGHNDSKFPASLSTLLGATRDDKLCRQNNGVHVPSGGESTDIDFYGKLTTVVQLLYKDRFQLIIFKCQWFDTNPNTQEVLKSTMA
ncbi:unnamed protein product [Prunus armeniaca]